MANDAKFEGEYQLAKFNCRQNQNLMKFDCRLISTRFGPDSLSKTWSLAEATETMDDSKLSRTCRDVNFWNDHELVGKWKGHRSSSFSKLGRIIYKIEDCKVKLVKVMKITATHGY